jgi:hypothetical protein
VERLADDPPVIALPIAADGTVEADGLGGHRFVGVVAAADADELLGLLAVLRPHVAEVVFTADPDRPWRGEHEAPLVVLERGWLGQDFVFEVADLVAAVRYATRAIGRERERWEGTAVLVVASASGVDTVRQALSSGCS